MKQDTRDEKFAHMTTMPIKPLIMSMAIPSVVSMLISALYNMADTFFIGKISTEATGAIGIVFAFNAFIQAISFFFGQGSGNFISRALGSRNTDKAEKMAATGFFSALIFGIIVAIPCFIFIDPLLRFLGATETILPDARSYFMYLLPATPFIMTSFVLNNQMRLQGNANKGMIGILTGALLNIVLDPILIFVFKLGIAGAAIATSISQIIGFIVLFFMSRAGDGIRMKLKLFTPTFYYFREIAAGGLPSLFRQGLASIATVFLNQSAAVYGDSAIAAFSVISRFTLIAMSALLGFGQGYQPFCGFNFGAGLYDRVKKGFWFCVRVSTVFLTAIAVISFIFAEPIVMLFRSDDPVLTEIAAQALRYQSFVFPLLGFTILVNMYLQNTRKTFSATITAVARQGLIYIPVVLICSKLFGLTGIQLTQPISDILTFFLALPLGLTALYSMGKIKQ